MQIQYVDTIDDDFDALADLRIDSMRESLEKIGRFNRERSIERFRSSYVSAETTRIFCEGVLTGFYSISIKVDHLHLSHLYVRPDAQCLGIGTMVMEAIIQRSIRSGLPIRLGALKESRSNDFYQKHGFVKTAEDEWDTYYERTINNEQDASQKD